MSITGSSQAMLVELGGGGGPGISALFVMGWQPGSPVSSSGPAPFDTIVEDSAGICSLMDAGVVITSATAGWWFVTAQGTLIANDSGGGAIQLDGDTFVNVNGSAPTTVWSPAQVLLRQPDGAAIFITLTQSVLVYVAEGDIIGQTLEVGGSIGPSGGWTTGSMTGLFVSSTLPAP